MAKGFTLDTRRCLYGEVRLSDAQVAALRRYLPRTIPRALVGIQAVTLTSLDRAGLIDLTVDRITERGRKTLDAIDAATATEGR